MRAKTARGRFSDRRSGGNREAPGGRGRERRRQESMFDVHTVNEDGEFN